MLRYLRRLANRGPSFPSRLPTGFRTLGECPRRRRCLSDVWPRSASCPEGEGWAREVGRGNGRLRWSKPVGAYVQPKRQRHYCHFPGGDRPAVRWPGGREAILDGEIGALDAHGRPSFRRLATPPARATRSWSFRIRTVGRAHSPETRHPAHVLPVTTRSPSNRSVWKSSTRPILTAIPYQVAACCRCGRT